MHASDNFIERSDALRSLAYLARLHTLTLSGNPIARGVAYRVDVGRRLPAIHVLDGTALEGRAPAAAAQRGPSQHSVNSSARPPLEMTTTFPLPGFAPASTLIAAAPAAVPQPTEYTTTAAAQQQQQQQAIAAAIPPPNAAPPPLERPAPVDDVNLRLSQQRDQHLRELTAAEHKLALERERHEAALTDERMRHEAECRGLSLANAAALQARDEELDRQSHEVERLTAELRVLEVESVGRVEQASAQLEIERATCRQLRAYIAGLAASDSPSTQQLAVTAVSEVGCQAMVEPSPRPTGGVVGVSGVDEEEVEWLRSSLRAAATEKELLEMRLEAMSRLQVLQEEALCAGLEQQQQLPPPPQQQQQEEGGALVASTAAEDVPSTLEATRAMVRGWRMKAAEMLMEAETERAARRQEIEANLEALEASATELNRQRQQVQILEARLAVCETEKTAERVGKAAAIDEAASVRKQLAAAQSKLTEEREATRALSLGVQQLAVAQQTFEGKLSNMSSSLRPVEERLSFALGRTQYLTRLQVARGDAHADDAQHGGEGVAPGEGGGG